MRLSVENRLVSSSEGDNESSKVAAIVALAREVPIYQDVIQPMAKETGKALAVVGRAVNVALMPLRGLVWSGEAVEKWIAEKVTEKLSGVSEEKIVSPDLAIAGPIMESLRFSGNNPLLSDMFASLLAGAMNSDKSEAAHPIFAEKIKSLSTLDALIFREIAPRISVPTIGIIQITVGIEGESPIVLFQCPEFHQLAISAGCSASKVAALVQASIENLASLALISAQTDGWLTSPEHAEKYSFMMESWEFVNYYKAVSVQEKFSFAPKRSYVQTTGIGRQFSDLVF